LVTRLFSASNDYTIQCWNSETAEPIEQQWIGHTDYVVTLSLSPDGKRLTSTLLDKTVRFWDAHSGNPIEQPATA
jgi:WD40 repeat protein